MAVEARHQNLSPQQIIPNNGEFVKVDEPNGMINGYNNYMQMGSTQPLTPTINNPWLTLNYNFMGMNNTMIQPQQIPMKAESGLTSNLAAVPRKRSREIMENQLNNFPLNTNTFGLQPTQNNLSADQIQQLEIDYILSDYTKRMKMEIVERQRQDAKWLFARVRGPLMKKLKEKEEEIISMVKLNSALQEKVKSLYIENQIWKDAAQSNEATAQTLRNNLENVMAHVNMDGFPATTPAAADQEAESCCGSNELGVKKEGRMLENMAGKVDAHGCMLTAPAEVGGGNRMCKNCGVRESCVLLLPCRHLCLCGVCGTALQSTCPACNSPMNATVHVSMV